MKIDNDLKYNQPEFEMNDFRGEWQLIKTRIDENVELLKQLSDTAKVRYGEDSILGDHFWIPVADGQVPYQVVSMTAKTAKVQRCAGICPDLYYDSILGYDCTLPISKATELVGRRRALERIFSSKKKTS